MKKILLTYAGVFETAGVQAFLANTLSAMDQSGLMIHLFVSGEIEPGQFGDALAACGCVLMPQGIKEHGWLRTNYQTWKALSRVLGACDYDIIHINASAPTTGLIYVLCARLYGIKHRIVHSHSAGNPNVHSAKKLIQNVLRKLIAVNANTHLGCSKEAAAHLFGKQFVKKGGHQVMRNGVNAAVFAYNHVVRQRIRNDLTMGDSQFVVGHVGRFHIVKNHAFLIDVFEQIIARHPESVLMLIGSGELEPEIRKRVSDKGLDKRVLFLGVRDDVDELMQSMDLFVLPSIHEGMPIVSIEAQAAGLHAIVSDSVSQEAHVTDLIEFIPLNFGAEAWAKAILRYSDGYEREDMTAVIRDVGYDIKDTSLTLEKIYRA